MTEKFRPQPENPKQHAPEAGAGPLGLPPPDSEQTPQGGGSKSPEFDLRGQGEEARTREKARIDKMLETRWNNRNLTPEERYQKMLESQNAYRKANKEKVKQYQRTSRQRRKERLRLAQERKEKRREYDRLRYQRRKEQRRINAEQQQPSQVFPPPEE
jgi:hypothetical protein